MCMCVFARPYTESSEKSTVLKLSDFSSKIGAVVVGLIAFWPVKSNERIERDASIRKEKEKL